jgi:hypothetical protein
MVGVPAVVTGAVNAFDILYRNPRNQLMHASSNGTGWKGNRLPGVIISDPAAVTTDKGKIDIVAFGGDYRLYHWRLTDKGVTPFQLVGGSQPGFGNPALVTRGPKRLHIFYRGFDRALHHVQSTGEPAPWRAESLGGTVFDFPTAVALPGGGLRAYVRGANSQLAEAAWSGKGAAWRWTSISQLTGRQGIAGSPSASVQGAVVRVHARTPAARLSTFTFDKMWKFADHGRQIAGSPTATSGGAFARGAGGGLLWFDGAKWFRRAGLFD